MEKPSLLMIIVLSVLGIALLFTCIGIGTTYWYEVKDNHFHSGLWKRCFKSDGVELCQDIDDIYIDAGESVPSWFQAVRAMTILSVFAHLGALSLGISTIFMPANYRKLMQIFNLIASYAAGALLLIGIIIYVAKIEDIVSGTGVDHEYAYSFILIVVALILCIISGIVGIVAILRGGQQTTS